MSLVEGWAGHTIDVAVIGAGAAGVAAARYLASARPELGVLVLEASGRIGGRALTVAAKGGGEPVDLGCGWLHGARSNLWTRVAGDLGFSVDRSPAPWNSGGRRLGLTDQDQAAATAAIDGFFERLDQHGDKTPDGALSDMLEPGNPWNGLLEAIGTFINGVELEAASIVDYGRYEPGPGPDWRVRDGYGHLIATYAAPLRVVPNVPVTRIDHRDAAWIGIETARGTLRARAAIVTASTTVLASGAIVFDPPLPAKLAAAGVVPVGVANKLFLRVAEPDDLPIDGHVMGSPHRTRTAAYMVRPFGRPLIECYFGGALARDIEAGGETAALAFAADELADHFGNGIRRRLGVAAVSAWARDPFCRGSYSYARPGAADQRAVLAEPVDDRIFFAGEACPPARFSTAHGAYESGVTAAQAIPAEWSGR